MVSPLPRPLGSNLELSIPISDEHPYQVVIVCFPEEERFIGMHALSRAEMIQVLDLVMELMEERHGGADGEGEAATGTPGSDAGAGAGGAGGRPGPV